MELQHVVIDYLLDVLTQEDWLLFVYSHANDESEVGVLLEKVSVLWLYDVDDACLIGEGYDRAAYHVLEVHYSTQQAELGLVGLQLPLIQHLLDHEESKRNGDGVDLALGLLGSVGLFALERIELHLI